MPTLDFPTSIRPARVRWKLRTNTQIHRSPLSGVPTSYELPGARWEAVLEFRDWRRAELAALEVLLAKLRGPAGRVRVWNHAREVARGVATGTPAVVGAQNLLTYPEALDNAAWFKKNVVISPDSALAPDGTMTADKMVGESSVDSLAHLVQRVLSAEAGIVYTKSVFAMAQEVRYLTLFFGGEAFVQTRAKFDLVTGEILGATGNAIDVGIAPTAIPGMYRCHLTAMASVTGSSLHRFAMDNDAASTNNYSPWVGDGTSGMVLWGAQLQPYGLGDYIKTEGAPALPAAQTGTTLRTSGWTPNTLGIMKAGDLFEVNGELKMLTEDANSDAYGNAMLTFEPPLRNAPPDLTPINTTRPSAVMMLADDDQVDIDYVRSTGSLSLRFIEAIE